MHPRRLFVAGDIALVRVSSRGKSSLPEIPDLDPRDEEGRQRLVRFIAEVTADRPLMEAILLSSPTLFTELNKAAARDDLKPTALVRLASSVSRYVARMRSRATPFGLMAGVALGRASERAKLRTGDSDTKLVRPDGAWLTSVIRRYERSPELMPTVRVWANPMCQRRGNRLILPNHHPYEGSAEEQAELLREGSVRLNALVAEIIDRCTRPVELRLLIQGLRDAFPRLPGEGVWAAVRALLTNGFLLSELWTVPLEADPLGRMLDLVGRAGDPATAQIAAARSALASYAATKVGQGADLLVQASSVLQDLSPEQPGNANATTVHVDLNVDVELHLPRHVWQSAERAASTLQRMAEPRSQLTALADYRDDFIERYGLMNPVPVLEIVNADQGIGVPAGYQRPPGHRTSRVPNPTSRQGIVKLADAAHAALHDGSNEVELTEELISAFDSEPETPVWPSVDLTVQVHSASVDAIDRGDYRLSLVQDGAAPYAGRMSGRFLEGLRAVGRFHEMLGRHQSALEPLRVQVHYRPPSARQFNVAHAPALQPCYLSIDRLPPPTGSRHRSRPPRVLDIRQVGIYASPDGLHAVDLNDGRELSFNALHMFNVQMAPNVARLLESIELLNSRSFTAWGWRSLDVWPKLPRVRQGRTVLYPASWRPTGLLDTTRTGPSDWADRIARWQDRYGVPDRIVAVSIAQRLSLDMSRPGDRHLLRTELERTPDTQLFEDLTGVLGGNDWLDGREHEITISLFADAERRRPARPRINIDVPPRSPASSREHTTFHLPGEDWAYFRLYLSSASGDTFVAGSLHELMNEMLSDHNRWFYVRYEAPEAHIRLRIQSDRKRLYPGVLAKVVDWAREERQRGSLRNFDLATYTPETWRYGPGPMMEAAEDVFCSDSRTTQAQLRGRIAERLEISRTDLAAVNYVQMFESLDVPRWKELARQHIAREHAAGVSRQQRQRLRQMVDLSGSWDTLARDAAGRDLIASWQDRSLSLARYGRLLRDQFRYDPGRIAAAVLSLAHMHFNRLCGIDQRAERQSLSLFRELVQAHLARTANS